MGFRLFDQYSLLHFSVGVVTYFWGVNWKLFFILHTLFEILENTPMGMKFINNFTFWPGGKPKADSLQNIIGDTISAILGWYVAKLLDDYGKKNKWYL
jgi:membrane glycosyltransferase